MNSMIAVRLIVASASLSMVCVMAACSRTQARATETPPVSIVTESSDVTIVTVPHPEQFPIVAVAVRDTHPELQVTGAVAADVARTVPVNSLTGGRVVDVRVRLGDTVAKGQTLLTMTSPDVAQARADVQKAQADAVLARQALDRARTLSEHEALAAKDLEAAVNADEKARADLRGMQDRLRMMSGGLDSATAVIEIRAPVSGVITEQNVTGSAGVKSLDNSPNLFTISDLSRVWVLCDVYENQLGQVRLGDTAAVRLNAFPDRQLTARVSNISRVLDPATRSAKVRLELPNPDGVLRPGMFATVVFTAHKTEPRAMIPASAVLRLHDRDWVFVPDGASRFRRVEIQAGAVAIDGLEAVLSGVAPGQPVVANALQLSNAVQQ
jgi:cobalt-zinc-cadmium efflux system membrane fusion protein